MTYLTALPNDFISDARALIPGNPSLLNSNEWLAWFSREYFWGSNVMSGFNYRPLAILSYLLTLRLGGPNPLSFLVGNLLIHAGASVLVLVLGRRLIGAEASWLGALVFAVHPLHTEAVAWIGGRPDLLSALFALASAIYFLRATEQESHRPALFALLAVASYFAALFSKEHAITLPIWFAAASLIGPGKRSARWAGVALGGSLVVLVLFLALRTTALPSGGSVASITKELGGVWVPWRWLAGLAIVGKYTSLFFWPGGLTFDYTLFPAAWTQSGLVEPLEALWGGAVVAGFLAALVWAIRDDRGLALVLAFIPITYAVVSAFPVTPQLYIAERFTYLASAGACLAAGWLLLKIGQRVAGGTRRPQEEARDGLSKFRGWIGSGSRGRIAASVFVGLIAVLALRSAIRNVDWRSTESVARAAITVSPDSPLALRGLGELEYESGNFQTARTQLERSLRLNPRRSEPYALLAQIYVRDGEVDKLVALSVRAAAEIPSRHYVIHDLGGLVWQAGRSPQAEQLFRQNVSRHPDFFPSRLALGGVLLQNGRAAEALDEFQRAGALSPDNALVWLGMAQAARALGRLDESRAYAAKAKAAGVR